MKDLQVFQNEEFGSVRVVADDNNNPWFVAKDVCDVLTITNSRDAIANLDEDEKGVSVVATPSGKQEMNLVTESGLYSLIFQSRKPEAKKFRKWVTSEVLPSIRKTGGYSNGNNQNDSQLIDVLIRSNEAITNLVSEFMKPRAEKPQPVEPKQRPVKVKSQTAKKKFIGRREIDPGDRKQHVWNYIEASKIEACGGLDKLREDILDWVDERAKQMKKGRRIKNA